MKQRFTKIWGWDKKVNERKAQIERQNEDIREEVRELFRTGHSGCHRNNSKYRGLGQSMRFL